MTDQEKYIAGQKASGIEVGDTAKVTREWKQHDDGNNTQFYPEKMTVKERVISKIDSDGDVCLSNGWWYPWTALEIVKKADGSVPDKTETLITGESTMKTQEIYNYVVTENINVVDAETGLIVKTEKKILGSGTVAAYDEPNAKLKAMKGISMTDVDIDEVEVLVRPFCG